MLLLLRLLWRLQVVPFSFTHLISAVSQSPFHPLYSPEAVIIQPGHFRRESHFYPRAQKSVISTVVQHFFELGNHTIAQRYQRLHPSSDDAVIENILRSRPSRVRWAGCDLMLTVNEHSVRNWILIETNSCPSGQKSMPQMPGNSQAGYRELLEKAFLPYMTELMTELPAGGLAVLYDKNVMEASGYAAVLADLTQEAVYLVQFPEDHLLPNAKFVDGVLYVKSSGSFGSSQAHRRPGWLPIRAALRYVTQRPWTRIPPLTKTLMFNPVLVCLAGGRNKMLAAKAYRSFNEAISDSGLAIRVPDTVWDVSFDQIPQRVEELGGVAVIKAPYSNAGQGVYTITSASELQSFMMNKPKSQHCAKFVVQALVGGHGWASKSTLGELHHLGTFPDSQTGAVYATDLRVMVGASPDGYFPVAIYARKAHLPLPRGAPDHSSWQVLGTNLSILNGDGTWATEEDRLFLMDDRGLASLGIGLDDFIEAYVQSVMACIAIDQMCTQLVHPESGDFLLDAFSSVNPDEELLEEIMVGSTSVSNPSFV